MVPEPLPNVPARDALAVVVAWLTLATGLIGLLLLVLHVIALHGRRLLPTGLHRFAGTTMVGVFLGLVTVFTWRDPFFWLLVALFVVWVGRWFVRERRAGEFGLLIAASGVPWTLAMSWLLIVERRDPSVFIGLDPRFLFLVAGLVVTGTGIAVAIANPGASARPHQRPRSIVERGTLVSRAIERSQAVGPVAAPAALGFAAGVVAMTLMLFLIGPRNSFQGLGAALPFVAFASVTAVVWILTVPKRVRHAHESLQWLSGRERERWQREIGIRLPVTARALPRLLDRIPENDVTRPLRVELLHLLGRDQEAAAELEWLRPHTPETRLEHATLVEQLAAFAGEPDQRESIRAAIDQLTGEEERLAGRAQLAYADARRAALDSRDAVEPLAAIRPEIGDRANRYQFGYRRGVILVVGSIGALAAVLVTVTALLSS